MGSNPTRCQLFRCRYHKIHLFPAKYRPYAFLLWADTRNVVEPSPAQTVWVQIPPGAKFFRCRYKKIHLFPAKYRPYAFLLWADRRNVVAPSPARTVWVQIPPCAKIFRRRYKKIYFFRPNIDHMRFCYALIRVMWLHLRPPEQCGFKSHQANFFRCRYKQIHLCPVKYRPYAFLLLY